MVFPGLIYLLGPKRLFIFPICFDQLRKKTFSQRILKTFSNWNSVAANVHSDLQIPTFQWCLSQYRSSCNSLQTWQEWHNHIWEVLMARPMKERRRWPRNINLATQSCMSTPTRAAPTHNIQLKTVKQANNLVRNSCYLKCVEVLVFRLQGLSTFLVTMS